MMKTLSKTFQQAANIAIVQFETLTDDGFHFLPAGPAIQKGDLVLRELDEVEDVNTLLAINKTDNFYLLTDMDLLKGARQNRVVNISVLVGPHEKRKIDVSCVERSRWSYDSPQFRPGERTMDASARMKKIESLKSDRLNSTNMTQHEVWENINIRMTSEAVDSPTEDYNKILEEVEKRRIKELRFTRMSSSNGIAVFEGKKLVGFDLFGNRLCYAHYFDMLEKDALDRVRNEGALPAVDQTEAFLLLEEFLGRFESSLEEDDSRETAGNGKHKWSGSDSAPGFALEYEEQVVHMVGFSK